MDLSEQDMSAMLRAMAQAAMGELPTADALLSALAQLVAASLVIDAELLPSPGGGAALGAAHVWGLRPGRVICIAPPMSMADGEAKLLTRLASLQRWLHGVISPGAGRHREESSRTSLPHTLRLTHCVATVRPPSGDAAFRLLAACRDATAPPFDRRDERIVHLLQDPLAQLRAATVAASPAAIEPAWAASTSPGLDDLPPYLQRISSALLTGAGEKQIAARLGFTYNTVHQYIKVIYRRLGVNSRAEFMARAQAGILRGQQTIPPAPMTDSEIAHLPK